MTIKRIGFACKFIDRPDQVDGVNAKDDCKKYNTGTTTVAWLKRQSRAAAEDKLTDLMKSNIEAVKQLVTKVGTLDPELRMVRLSSDILPVYTHADYSYFWRQADVIAYMEREFGKIGDIARRDNIKLSMHPGQFTVLASENPGIVQNSIEEFEYHVDMARWMGYGKQFQDFKINVHISGKQGPAGIISALERLSPEARNTLTIENDENSWGLDASLELEKHCALVLDIHHQFIRTGEYILPTDDRYLRVIDSWRGVRPTIHYSYSRNEHFPTGFTHDDFPNMNLLLEQGAKKQKLRAHSDNYPNQVVNEWALSFLDTADIMCESKMKNLASFELHKFWKNLKKSVTPILESKTHASIEA
jgi:UV DNA damage endonuclease